MHAWTSNESTNPSLGNHPTQKSVTWQLSNKNPSLGNYLTGKSVTWQPSNSKSVTWQLSNTKIRHLATIQLKIRHLAAIQHKNPSLGNYPTQKSVTWQPFNKNPSLGNYPTQKSVTWQLSNTQIRHKSDLQFQNPSLGNHPTHKSVTNQLSNFKIRHLEHPENDLALSDQSWQDRSRTRNGFSTEWQVTDFGFKPTPSDGFWV